ncbi:iron-containing alcohol dehydrogenase [Numidum massiliense]|uniref:iron-containing alcohol dehydrogenase n=1 Tax=Numidum massiliense TaxID=1522315 RepID=UPI0006D532CE|nr:iron-containing alcohol dehydrogenase [Numidum massiliense]
MSFFVFRTPQTIVYGNDSFQQVGAEASAYGKKALIVSDNIIEKLGYVRECQRYLRSEGIQSVVYTGVNSEPTDEYVAEALALQKKERCDLVISIGGGSCIDTVKAVAVLATNGGYIGDYMDDQKKVTRQPMPHMAIPTTAGTGSEATDVTVITNTADDVKMMIKQPAFMPSVALVDPVLTQSSPGRVTAATGIDALSHAIEAYLSKRAQPMTDTLALSAMRLITRNIRQAYREGDDVAAREAMSLGSLQAGMAFTNASVCLVHGMSRPIGALFHVPHGVSNAMLLPAVLQFSKDACIERLADLGRIFLSQGAESCDRGSQPTEAAADQPKQATKFSKEATRLSDREAADVAVREVNQLCIDLQILNVREWGIDEQTFNDAIEKMAEDALASGSPANNPRVPTKDEIVALYRVCYDYDYSCASVGVAE